MENLLGAMSPQMLRMMFASRSAQEQGYEMVLGMLRETGVRWVLVADKVGGVDIQYSPDEYAQTVLRSLLGQFDLPYLLGGNDATGPNEGVGTD